MCQAGGVAGRVWQIASTGERQYARPMKLSSGMAGVLAVLLGSSFARAQERPVEPEEPARTAPRARTGFQLALRTGASIPFGKYADSGSANMSDFVSPQVPLLVDIGGKIGRYVFVGGYLGLGFGGAAGTASDACDRTNASCASVSLRLGPQVLFFFRPDQKVDPWVGYGFGWESTALASSTDRLDTATGFAGWEFAHFMGGVDFRISRIFGIGPFVDFALGSYTRYSFQLNPGPDDEGSIEDPALHGWLTVGARFVFFP